MNRNLIIPLFFISASSFASASIKSFNVKLIQGNFISTQNISLNNNHASFSFLGRMYDIDIIQGNLSDTSDYASAKISVQMPISAQNYKIGTDVIDTPDINKFVTRVPFKNKQPVRVNTFGVNAEFIPL